jgi:hypothetical protein
MCIGEPAKAWSIAAVYGVGTMLGLAGADRLIRPVHR